MRTPRTSACGCTATSGSEVSVCVSDDGAGMQPSQQRTGLGLPGLRERVEALGGRFEFRPGKPRGLEVRAHIPVSAE